MDHVYHTGCHITFRIHSTLAIREFDTLLSLFMYSCLYIHVTMRYGYHSNYSTGIFPGPTAGNELLVPCTSEVLVRAVSCVVQRGGVRGGVPVSIWCGSMTI